MLIFTGRGGGVWFRVHLDGKSQTEAQHANKFTVAINKEKSSLNPNLQTVNKVSELEMSCT